MGNRISLQFIRQVDDGRFVKLDEKSPILYSHWSGDEVEEFLLRKYIPEIKNEFIHTTEDNIGSYPLYRAEVEVILMDFIIKLINEHSLYANEHDFRISMNENTKETWDKGHYAIYFTVNKKDKVNEIIIEHSDFEKSEILLKTKLI